MAGAILALQMSTPNPNRVLPWDGVPWDDGWRALMVVTRIMAKVQTTVFYGNSLYMIWYDIGSLTREDGFAWFLKNYYNKPLTYGQLVSPPYAAIPARYRILAPTPPPPPADSQGTMTLLSAGYYPVYGYYMEFAGNFFLTSPIFQNWSSQVVREGPNFKGFQPSQNNPGSGNSGQGC